MDLFLPIVLGIFALAFFVLWRREVAGRIEQQVQAIRSERNVGDHIIQSESRVRQLQAALDSSIDMLLVVDSNLQVLNANQATHEKFGELSDQPSVIRYVKSLELVNLLEEVESWDGEAVIERVISVQDRPHRARILLRSGWSGIALTDVAELQRLSRARQDMITNLSHELRTPLTSLRLLAETIGGPAGQDPEVARDLVGKIVVELDHLNQMSEELLDLSAIESGKQIMRLVPMPLYELVHDPVERLVGQTTHRNITLQISIDEGITVLADREQASRAIQNVLHNAVKYTQEGGEVLVKAELMPEEECVVLSIADSGPGIPPDELERVFERFYRSHWAWGTPGTGIGLAIARHILQAHGGRIWAENRALPDAGAVFYLAFRLG